MKILRKCLGKLVILGSWYQNTKEMLREMEYIGFLDIFNVKNYETHIL